MAEKLHTNKRKKRNRLGILFLVVFLVLALIGGYIAYKVWGPNTAIKEEVYVYIPTGADYEDVLIILKEGKYIKDINSFDILAGEAKYPEMVKPGKYRVSPGMSNYGMIRMLRSGEQIPVKLTIKKVKTKDQFAKLVAKQLEPTTNDMKEALSDTNTLIKYSLDTNTAMSIVIPDTYEFYWNTSAPEILERLGYYYKKFWTDERKQKADKKGLSPKEVSIVASIVEEETNKDDEKPQIASVYLNRLTKNMKLQADPTVKYALQDFSIRRILKKHLTTPSPYNTYVNTGLPPGPIATPSKASIDAVLNAPKTDYLFFCANPRMNGYHLFAATYKEHMQNARSYHRELNKRGL